MLLPYFETPGGSGPPMLFVHGLLSSRAQWMLNIPVLKQYCRPVVVELWGHARSPTPENPADYHPDAYVEAFEGIREKLGIERWFICGQSFGAGLTLRYALTHPERVLAQVFTNSISALADEEAVAEYRANAVARSELVLKEGHKGLEKIAVHPRHAHRLPPRVQRAMLADAARHDPKAFAMSFRYTSPNLSVRPRIAANKVPTLLICGSKERGFRPIREFAEQAVPRITCVDAEAGHAVNIQAADIFDQAVIDLIGKYGDASGDQSAVK